MRARPTFYASEKQPTDRPPSRGIAAATMGIAAGTRSHSPHPSPYCRLPVSHAVKQGTDIGIRHRPESTILASLVLAHLFSPTSAEVSLRQIDMESSRPNSRS